MRQLYYDFRLLTVEVVITIMVKYLINATPLVVDKRINIVFYAKIFPFF